MSNRWLHPGAWWIWALGLGAAATRTANPLLLGLIVAVAALVVMARRPQAQWAKAFTVFVRLAVAVVAIRVVFAQQCRLVGPARNERGRSCNIFYSTSSR